MKICRILKGYSPYSLGGADIYTEKISRKLSEAGNRTVIITINPSKGERVEQDGATRIYRFHPFNVSTFHRIGRESLIRQGLWTMFDLYSLYSYKKIRAIIEKEKPDIVHLHTPIDVTMSAVDAVKDLGLPLVYTLHDYFLLCRKLVLLHGFVKMCNEDNINPLCRMYRAFSRKVIDDKIDTVIAPSRFVLDLHRKYGFFKDTKSIVLPNGIEIDDAIGPFDKKIGNAGTFDILYTGSLIKPKGVGVLIKAFMGIEKKNMRLHIVGDGVFAEDLKRLAKNDIRIIFYGNRPNPEAQDFYRKADVSVVPSIWYDVRPNVIPEAFRAGVPVIGSDIGGIPELIKDGYNGFLFKAGDEAGLKTILRKIADDPGVLKGMRYNARESVKAYDISFQAARLTDIYKEAIESNNRRRMI